MLVSFLFFFTLLTFKAHGTGGNYGWDIDVTGPNNRFSNSICYDFSTSYSQDVKEITFEIPYGCCTSHSDFLYFEFYIRNTRQYSDSKKRSSAWNRYFPQVTGNNQDKEIRYSISTSGLRDDNIELCVVSDERIHLISGEIEIETQNYEYSKDYIHVPNACGCTYSPTRNPTRNPTKNPTKNPTRNPTNNPTMMPTQTPSQNPTNNPTMAPTNNPTNNPTYNPTDNPSVTPTNNPTNNPSVTPTTNPTNNPTITPSNNPSQMPTTNPTNNPSVTPTSNPTNNPSVTPTSNPTNNPSITPTNVPSMIPTVNPTACQLTVTLSADLSTNQLTVEFLNAFLPVQIVVEDNVGTTLSSVSTSTSPEVIDIPTSSGDNYVVIVTDRNGCTEANTIFIAPADYIIITYEFVEPGRDLDTRTRVVQSGAPYLGWSADSQWPITDPIVTWAGDNTGTGFESVLVDLTNYQNLYPSENEIQIQCNAWWFGDPTTEPVNVAASFIFGASAVVDVGLTFEAQDAFGTLEIAEIDSVGTVVPGPRLSFSATGFPVATLTYNLNTGVGMLST